MGLERRVRVTTEKGLHTRVAAAVAHRAAEVQARWGVRLTIAKGDRVAPADNLLAVVGLGTRGGDELVVRVEGDGEPRRQPAAESALLEFTEFLRTSFDPAGALAPADRILHETTLTLNLAFDSMANGVVAVNRDNVILLFNPAAERILGVPASRALGRRASEVIPGSRLAEVMATGRAELGQRQRAGAVTIITNRTPVVVDGQVVGAVAVFQDISDVEKLAGQMAAVQELKEHLHLVLQTVQEGLCATDDRGRLTYVNRAFELLTGQSALAPGTEIRQVLPEAGVHEVLRSGRPVLGRVLVTAAGLRAVADTHPLRVGRDLRGTLTVLHSATEVEELAELLASATARAAYLARELGPGRRPDPAFQALVGSSPALQEALAVAAKAASSQSTVLIRGESGTGKELVARGIHAASPRRNGPFVRVNCAAIPPGLIESELFGHERGAFTGAHRRHLGKFELARGGTIFLDEIGLLDRTAQAKLLRVLQEREFERVGGEAVIRADVRVIAATNENLEEMVASGAFREDLYYRLNVISIYLPPLRERRGDIPVLAEHFVARFNAEMGRAVKGLTREALMALMHYDWPGNVRQLENVIERAMNLTEDDRIGLDDLPTYLADAATTPGRLVNPAPDGGLAPWEAYEEEIIRLALERHGSFHAAAKALGLTHKTVAAKARRFGLAPPGRPRARRESGGSGIL